jgi:hypothetical protein
MLASLKGLLTFLSRWLDPFPVFMALCCYTSFLLASVCANVISEYYPALFTAFFATLHKGTDCPSEIAVGRKIKTKTPRKD